MPVLMTLRQTKASTGKKKDLVFGYENLCFVFAIGSSNSLNDLSVFGILTIVFGSSVFSL